jgi:hypothetical protein
VRPRNCADETGIMALLLLLLLLLLLKSFFSTDSPSAHTDNDSQQIYSLIFDE